MAHTDSSVAGRSAAASEAGEQAFTGSAVRLLRIWKACYEGLKVVSLQGMEVYSTVLWHLKRDSELSHLAQEAVGWDRRSPHTWAIMGNCFSLQKVPFALSASPLALAVTEDRRSQQAPQLQACDCPEP